MQDLVECWEVVKMGTVLSVKPYLNGKKRLLVTVQVICATMPQRDLTNGPVFISFSYLLFLQSFGLPYIDN